MSRSLRMALVLAAVSLLPMLAATSAQPPTPPVSKENAKPPTNSERPSSTAGDPIERIKEEGLKRSQVMATLGYLTDVIGPRLTGSPNLKRANEWTRSKLAEWGLENAHLEPWGPFGRGWALNRFSAQVVEPQCIPLIAYPKAWSPGVEGTLIAPVVYLDAKTEADLGRFKGKLKGAIVVLGPAREIAARFEPPATRLTDSALLSLANAPEASATGPGRRPPGADGRGPAPGQSRDSSPSSRDPLVGPPRPRGQQPSSRGPSEFSRKRLQFLIDEEAALSLDPSGRGDGGTLFVASAAVPGPAPRPGTRRVSAWLKDAPPTLPQLVVADEHYNRLVRMLEKGESLKVAVELSVRFLDDDPMAYNTIAEIPGTDLKQEVVMLGGHMDSWHSGTGATDNGAGVAAVLEAVRILKALDLKPRRTIRVGLWTGEEQGLLGSRAYVAKHFGGNPDPLRSGRPAPSTEGGSDGGSTSRATTPEFETFSAYYNLDNGTGKVRGVYLQGNEAVAPLFRKWLQPFGELGASTLSLSNTGGTDHLSFDSIGLPGFQFIQDAIEYESRTHHSNQDVFDRIQEADMKQAATVLAAFAYNTAMRDEKLPRKPRSARRPEPTARPADPAVAATIETTLPTADEQIRQLALDGDGDSYFASAGAATEKDHFTVTFERPIAVNSIAVATGKPGGGDRLDSGTLEVTADGREFIELAQFADGKARGSARGKELRALRIKPSGDARRPLVVREIEVDADPPLATFTYPVEFVVDVSDAPEMKAWAEKAARACERAYPMINEELQSDGYRPPRLVRMALKSDFQGVAMAGGGRITGSVAYFKAHPDDVGAMVHETAHIVQRYGSRRNPSWLVEGVADFVRFFKYEPGKLGRIDPDRARYDRSYRVTAAFLAYLAETYDEGIVCELNRRMREGSYKEEDFKELAGKTVQQLDEEWQATLHR